jgi:isopenicillin-N epimerase
MDIGRRTFVRSAVGIAAASSIGERLAPTSSVDEGDELFWKGIAGEYDVTPDVTNLENGNWGIMARPVLNAYLEHTRRVNKENSYYSRRKYGADHRAVVERVASVLGAGPNEVAISRNATEALQNLITGYNRLKPGDAVLYSDLDYDSMQTAMEYLRERRGVQVVRIEIPEPASVQSVLDGYERALRSNPRCKLVLLTHLSHRTGLVMPVREIAGMARGRGADVILDAAHSWGQLDFKIGDLNVDFAGFNLHKWMGAPIGAGVMYVRSKRLADIDPYLAEPDPKGPSISTRVHTGTVNMAAVLTVPAALDFQERIGAARREKRLRALRDRWAKVFAAHPVVQLLTPEDPRMYGGMTSFRIRGKTSKEQNAEVAKRLAEDYRVFTVVREGVANGACVRVTPSYYTSAADIDRLIGALRKLFG